MIVAKNEAKAEDNFSIQAIASKIILELKVVFEAGMNNGEFEKFLNQKFGIKNLDRRISFDSMDRLVEEVITGSIRVQNNVVGRAGKKEIRTDIEKEIRLSVLASLVHVFMAKIELSKKGDTSKAWFHLCKASDSLGMSRASWFSISPWARANFELAKSGGDGRSKKIQHCRNEFLRLVDQHTPAWNRTKEGVAEAVLELKPSIVKYAKNEQNSVITASTNLPKKWLEDHWGLTKRAYKKSTAE